ncbi:MAG: type VI secretion system tip protein VgrG [Desulfobacteraceae bacterium]|nr:type VI secretion system tip protein VgrG [Desulfobacteraceae bacterium]
MSILSADSARFKFVVEGTHFQVVDFQADECISKPYDVHVSLASKRESAFEDIIGRSCLLTIESENGERYLHGIVHDFSRSGVKGRKFLYKTRIVPSMELLKHEKDCRIFQNKSVPDIVSQIMKEAGIAADLFEFRLQGSYAPRQYCVQYKESDFNFISRLLETEGIFYFFEHFQDRHVTVFGDGMVNYQPVSGETEIVINSGAGLVSEKEAIATFERTRRLHTGKFAHTDYLFTNPALNLSADSTGSKYDQYEAYEYPGGYSDQKAGKHLALVRLQQAMLQGDSAFGQGNVARMVPGFTFTLDGHDISDLNQEYVLTRITHKGDQPQVFEELAGTSGRAAGYGNTFSVIPSSETVRPLRVTPKPVMYGVHTAIITGPGGEEVHTDEHGRVKVQFHWDREGKNDQDSSCWIRVSQAWAGQGWGAMFVPRIGHEVIVDFIEGDPDRPIITGRVYHGTNTPPYSLPDEKTKSTIKTNSSKGGGGSNEIRFEDKKDSEEIYIHGQKDWTIAIDNDKNQTIGNDETLDVTNNRTKTVGADQSETISSNKTIKVGSNHNETIGTDMTQAVGSNKSTSVGSINTLSIGAAYQVTVGGAINETVGAAKAQEIGAAKSVNIGANSSENIGGTKSVKTGKDISGAAGKDLLVESGKKMSFSSGDDFALKGSKKGIIDIKDQLTIKVGKASITLKKNGDIVLKGKNINTKGSGNIKVKGKKILEN